MIDNLTPYPAYKDSGLLWLEEVPEHWDLIPNRALIRKRKILVGDRHTEYRLLSLTKEGIIVRDVESGKGKFSADMGTSQEVRAGDLIFCFFDIPETPRTVGLSHHNGMITGAYTVFECSAPVLSAFLELFYKAMDDRKLLSPLYSGLRNTIPPTRFLGIKTPVPPHDEQAAIVRFLDHMDRRIRRYIRARQKLISLLEEQKQAIIHRAVTRGLDPSVPLKPSGVEWLGDVPEDWIVAALRHRYSQCLGKMLDSKKITGKYPLAYLRNTDVQWHRINIKDLPLMDISPEEYERYTVRKGDLLVCEGGDVGRCALWSDEMPLCGFQKALHRLRPRSADQDVPRFMYYLLRAAAKCDAFNDGHLSTIAHLTGDKLRAHRFSFPPKVEQENLVNFLDFTLENIDKAISSALCEIGLLREYRTRLISDVVTGKLDVRGIDLPAADDTDVPEEFSDLLDAEAVMEDEEPQEIPAEVD